LAEGEVGFHNLDSSVLGRMQDADGKSVKNRLHQPPKQPINECPQCHSQRLYRGGFRYLFDGTPVQRWLCRDCNYRFSPPDNRRKPLQKTSNWQLNTASTLIFYRQESSESRKRRATTLLAGGLTLVTSQTQQNAQREGTSQPTDKTGKIVEFLWNLRQNGVKGNTLGSYSAVLRKLAKHTDLTSEAVKEYLAKTQEWNEVTKAMTVIVYGSFLKFNNLTWQPPKYRPVDRAPYIPTEAEIDQLISGSGRVLATFLQFLKETGARSGEAARLKWKDIDPERKIATITPEKGSRARILPISLKLIDMLNYQPKKTEKIFATAFSLKSNFYKTRKSIAFKLQNPRLKEIGLHTFRHWKATTEYHKTRDILHVQQLLGHRDLRNTLIYINLEKAIFQNADEEYHVKVAENLQEACKLLEVGFEYVTDLNGAKLFRKRK
jgi:integrase